MGGLRRIVASVAVMTIAGLALAGGAAQAAKFKVLHSFCEQGHRPCGDGGNDIDVNSLGGGVVFRLSPDTGTYKVLHSFCSAANCADGEYPLAGLAIDSSGSLLGTTSLGGAYGNDTSGGAVFRLTP